MFFLCNFFKNISYICKKTIMYNALQIYCRFNAIYLLLCFSFKNFIQFKKKIKNMEKKEALEKTLSMDYTQLVSSTTMKSELFLLTNDEFNQIYKHMNGSKYRMEEEGWDTIIICNTIFKKINE